MMFHSDFYLDFFKLNTRSIPIFINQNSSTNISPKIYLPLLNGFKKNFYNFTGKEVDSFYSDKSLFIFFSFFWVYIVGRSFYIFAEILENKEKIIKDSFFRNQTGEIYVDLTLPNYLADLILSNYTSLSFFSRSDSKQSALKVLESISTFEYQDILKNNWFHFEKIDDKNFLFKFPLYFFVDGKKEVFYVTSQSYKFFFISFCFFIKDLIMGLSRHFSWTNGETSFYFKWQINNCVFKYSRFIFNIEKNFSEETKPIDFVSDEWSRSFLSSLLNNSGSNYAKSDYSFIDFFGGISNIELIYLDILLGVWSHFLIMQDEALFKKKLNLINQKALVSYSKHIYPVFDWNFDLFFDSDLKNFFEFNYGSENNLYKIPFYSNSLTDLKSNYSFISLLLDPEIYRTISETSPYVLFVENSLERIFPFLENLK